MGVYCVIGLVFIQAVLGLESQGTDDCAVKLPTCEEMTSAIAQLTLLKMMCGGSHPLTGMAEMEELREEAAARDVRLQEIETVIDDIKVMIENDVQETLKGMAAQHAALRQEAAAQHAALRQEMGSEVASLREELAAQDRLREKVHEQTTCPDGWVRHESSCYRVDDTPRNWESSLEYCRSIGGDLAKITSAEEQQFIKANLGTRCCYWIGLNDKASEGRFLWTDGTAPTYTRWGVGHPDGGEGEDCVYMNIPTDGTWYDGYCSSTGGVAVCERPVHA